jgi:alanine dehydrogenase
MAVLPVLLTQSEVERLLSPAAYVDLVQEAFARRARGETLPSRLVEMDGEIKISASGLRHADSDVVAVRIGTSGTPGMIALFRDDGRPLAFMESATIHRLCTLAATAVATRHLARLGAQTLTICGTDAQAAAHADALLAIRPLGRIVIWGDDLGQATRLAAELADRHRIDTSAATNVSRAVAGSDIVVTLAPASQPYLGRDDIRPGTFVAAAGSEEAGTQELDPELLAGATVISDELGDIIAGTRPGRRDDAEIVVFDSTATAVQDAAAAQALYQAALKQNAGHPLPFWD